LEDGQLHDLRMNHPSLSILCASSGGGKTSYACKLMFDKDRLIKGGEAIKNVVVFYNAYQPMYDEIMMRFPQAKFVNRPPTNEEFVALTRPFAHEGGSLVLIDDWMSNIDQDFVEIASVSTRHYNCFVIMLFQAIFPPSSLARQVSLNAKYYHLFPDPRNAQSVATLARQMVGADYEFILDAFKEVTSEPFKPFTIDLTHTTPQKFRFRSNLFLEEGRPMSCFVPAEEGPAGSKKKKKKKGLGGGGEQEVMGLKEWMQRQRGEV